MENFEIVEYNTALAQAAEAQFARYVREDLKETFSDEILYEKIWRGIFVSGLEKGLLSIALPMLNGEPVGLLVYQVDTPESDWCKREGWGLIREFCIVPRLRRKGYGLRLTEYAEQRLREKTDKLYLTSDSTAVEFWSACGFAAVGEVNKNGTYTMTK